MKHLRRGFPALAATIAIGAWACSFPEIRIAGDTSGSGGGTSTSSSSTTGTGGGSGGMGGHGGSGGATTSSSSSSSTTSSTSSSSTTSSSGTGGGPCTTDLDHDNYRSWKCDPSDPTLDCADGDIRAHPGAGFQDSAIIGEVKGNLLPYDFDCNGAEEAETPTRDCPGTAFNCPSGEGFESAVSCGMAGAIGHCVPSGLGCKWTANNPPKTLVQRCK